LSLNVYKLERIGASANKGGQHEPAPSSPDAQDSIPF
jgi:hypothetical protein